MGGDTKQVKIEKRNFLGLSVSVFEKEQLVDFIIETVRTRQKAILYGYSFGTLFQIKEYPEIFFSSEKSDVIVTDGRLFYLFAKWHGIPLKHDISIPNLVLLVLELANKDNWSVYLLGAEDHTNKLAQENIRNKYNNIKHVSGHHGYFGNGKNDSVINDINSNNINILLIGISSPKKEIIAASWKDELNTNIIIPCGGMIDVLAGQTRLVPKWIKKIGLASVFRLLQEPKRLFKRYLGIYLFLIFRLIPTYAYRVVLKRDKHYSFIHNN